ncbi:MAG TPA: YoaK family protein [Azospira sp.]|nr:YoaK family protein [Azospira sp.]
MALAYLSALTAITRTPRANKHLGVVLAFVAGSLNAGGFLAVGQYTSHMTGILSAAADNLVLGNAYLVTVSLVSLLAFIGGAGLTAVLVNYGQRRGYANLFARPLLIEAVLILIFGWSGGVLQHHTLVTVSQTVVLLCFTMGLQNALITKISRAEIRTTHVTGLLTDLGIEVGKLFYWNRTATSATQGAVVANRQRLRIHLTLILAFFSGGVMGALGFKWFGFIAAMPLALLLAIVALAPGLRGTRPAN